MKGYATKKNRKSKAEKILAVLNDYYQREISNFVILDIGTGNGEIANYIAERNNAVYAVDVEKQIDLEDKDILFSFKEVKDEYLPFEDEKFDIVISNHVVEHVENSDLHFREINRVLKKGGIVYFATPNRNYIREPHTKTFFIHWLPYKMFFEILKKIGKYQEKIKLIYYSDMKRKFKHAGFTYKEYTANIINDPIKFKMDVDLNIKIPQYLQSISPTNIFILQKR